MAALRFPTLKHTLRFAQKSHLLHFQDHSDNIPLSGNFKLLQCRCSEDGLLVESQILEGNLCSDCKNLTFCHYPVSFKMIFCLQIDTDLTRD